MLQQLITIKFELLSDSFWETFVAPSSIVKNFAEFLADREEDDFFTIKGQQVQFTDCTVLVGDSKKAVAAFETLNHYNIPMSNFEICYELVNSEDVSWRKDPNFQLFSQWYISQKETDEQ